MKQFKDQLRQVKEQIFNNRVKLELYIQDLKLENHYKQERINELKYTFSLQNLQQCEDKGNKVGEISLIIKVKLGSVIS